MPKPPKIVDEFIAVPHPKDPRFINLTGQVFNRLTAISYAGNYRWNCLCSCGAKVTPRAGALRAGQTGSCGCAHKDWMVEYNTLHGESVRGATTPEYKAFHQAKNRCTNPNGPAYHHYGGRGIQFRFESFDQFLGHLGRRPTSEHTLDRIDVNGHYEVGNVRWATMWEQNRNRTDHRYVTIDGITKCVADWADTYAISPDTVFDRHLGGWCDHCSIVIPAGQGQTCSHKTISDS